MIIKSFFCLLLMILLTGCVTTRIVGKPDAQYDHPGYVAIQAEAEF